MKPIEIKGSTLCIPADVAADLKIVRVGKKAVFTTLTAPTLTNGTACYTITPALAAMKSGRYDGTLQGVNCAKCIPLRIECK